MVEGGGFPGGGIVALRASRPKLSGVGVVAGVTAEAILRCAFELSIFVAGKTRDVDVRAG